MILSPGFVYLLDIVAQWKLTMESIPKTTIKKIFFMAPFLSFNEYYSNIKKNQKMNKKFFKTVDF